MAEIVYVIDAQESKKSGLLAIQLVEADKTQGGFKLKSLSPLLPSRLRLLTSALDKEIVDLLIKEELQFQASKSGRTPHAESTSFHVVHINTNQASNFLQKIAATQKLYFNGKQLVADFFGKVEFYYCFEPLKNGQTQVSSRLKWRDQDIDFRECDWIGAGRPPWFIRGLSLKTISTSVSWKELQRAYENFPKTLSNVEKAAFLKEIDFEDPESPKVMMTGQEVISSQQLPNPMPILILKDRLGAFADLWMDYGSHRIALHDLSAEIKIPLLGAIRRNNGAEKNWEKDLLETDFVRKNVDQSHYYCPIDKVAKSLTFLLEIGWHIQDWKGNRVIKQNATDLAIHQTSLNFSVSGSVCYENHKTDIANVVGAFNRRERFIQLGEGTVGLLPSQWEQPGLQELAEEGEIVGQEIKIRKSHIGVLGSLFEQSRLSSELNNLKEKLKDFTHIEETLPSDHFQGRLRPYQQQGLNWLSFLVKYGFHGILADDMGLGKTVQVLALLSRLPQDYPHLIVVPTSLLFNWKNEIERFLPQQTFYVHQGPQRIRSVKELASYPCILTSYGTLRQDFLLFQNLVYGSLILDEAQIIKNAHTQTAQIVCSLQAQFRLSITGTPLENHLGEVWSHFHFLMPDLFGEEEDFYSDLKAAESDLRYLQRIKKKMAPFILRRKKSEVAQDLPELIDQVVWVEMEESQRQFYDQFLASVKGNLLKKVELDGIGKHRMEIFEAILRLRQICCHPLLLSSWKESENATSAKFEAVMCDLETLVEEKRKVLVYSQFTSMLQLMTKRAKEQKWGYAYLDGSTPDREKVVRSFQEDSSISLFFISLKAGGVGLNLTAADYVILYDPWWNQAVEEQAINRAHRIGRQKTVVAKRFVMRESIEERMMKLKATKQELIGEVLSDELNAFQLTIDDLYHLLY